MKHNRHLRAGAKPRRSTSAAASRRAEIRRLAGMSVEERIRVALAMGRRFAWLQPAPLGS